MDEHSRAAPETTRQRGAGRRGPHYKVLFVPPELHAEIKRLAAEQHRTIIGQVMYLFEEAMQREHARSRAAKERGAA